VQLLLQLGALAIDASKTDACGQVRGRCIAALWHWGTLGVFGAKA
jgi:hypothetical protein